MEEKGLGMLIAPPAAGTHSIENVLGASDPNRPRQFIVPYRRDCFDEYFETIGPVAKGKIRDQGPIDSCTAHGTSVQKSAQEGVEISPRDIWRVGKPHDWRGVASWGAPINAMQDGLVSDGAAEAALVDGNTSMGREKYTTEVATDAQKENRAKHKGRDPYYIERNLILETLWQLQIPIVTGSMWYRQDNAMAGAIMRAATTEEVGGHSYAAIGKVVRRVDGKDVDCIVMENSFGASWGDNGFFYVPLDGTERRLFEGYITLDVDENLSDILTRYAGKKVRAPGQAEHYLIEGGKKRHYADAFAWFAFGNLFGYNVYEIAPDELEAIPSGPEITIDQASFEGRELVRQIRQTLGLK